MKYFSRWSGDAGTGDCEEDQDENHPDLYDDTANTHAIEQDAHFQQATTTPPPPGGLTTNPHKNKFRLGRIQLWLSALVLCVTGVVHHMQQLPAFSSSSSPNLSSSRSSGQQHQFIHPALFVPSMDFNIMSQVTSSNYNKHFHGKYPVDQLWNCTHRAKELQWEWYNLPSRTSTMFTTSTEDHQKTTQNQESQRPQLLIGLFSGHDKYAEMLALSAHLAKVYAHTHNATVVVVQGSAMAPDGCTGPPWFSTLNKIRILFAAIDRRNYFDQLLLLEADALVVNMTADIASLLPSISSSSLDVLLAAQPIRQGDSRTLPQRYQIHAGVTLWNLHHPQCTIVALQWFDEAKKAVTKGTYWGDERYLQAVLQRQNPEIIQWLDQNNEFAFEEGTVVQHFFSHSLSWSHRKRSMEKVAKSVCETYDCSVVPRKDYDTHP